MRKRIIGILMIFSMFTMLIPNLSVSATCAYGIRNNGLGGIYIDINSAPYTTFATYSYGQYAYTQSGCAWFASARVNQITGLGNVIRGASNWYNNYSSYGFTRGSTPQAGSIICFSNSDSGHVAILEKIEGTTAYISEGGYRSAGAGYGYCNIRTMDVSQIANTYMSERGLTLMGYVYMGKTGDVMTPVDLGTDFYTYILNQPAWKPIECDPNGTNVYLSTDKWTANQRWYAKRNDDGSYTFINAANNFCLDAADYGNEDGTNVQAVANNGSDAQKWFVYYVNNQYIFKPKCSDKVLDLDAGATSDGTNVQLWTRNGSDAQSFNIYKVECTAGKPNIKSSSSNIHENQTLTVSWNKTDYTDHYLYYLTEYPEGYAYSTNTTSGITTNTSITFDGLKSGEYSCFIHSVSHQGKWGEQSNWVKFKVYADDYMPTKTVVSDGHIYALYDYEMSWSFARDLCKDLGGNLVSITSAEENKIITDLIQSGSKDAYWLGATDIDKTEKDFRWVTGEDFSYSNWKSGEPSSGGEEGEKEHFLEIRKSYNNRWNDVNNINKSNKGFILEVDMSLYSPIATETYDGNQYLLFDKNTTWTEAKVFCEQLGGHLATINTEEENQFIKNFIQSGERSWYYLGAEKDNGAWKWIDENGYDNISWYDTAATWTGNYLMMYKSVKACVGFDNAYFPQNDIKHVGFVCEIENYSPTPTPPPVSTPTPTPTPAPEYAFTVDDHGTYMDVTNNGETQTAAIIIVEYTDAGALKNVSFSDIAFAKGEKRTFMTGNGIYKLFVWDNLNGMKPLAKTDTL